MFQRVLSNGAGVSQICWIAPGPVISASVNVDLAGTRTKGETFHPWPRSRAAPFAAPSVDMPALPFSPLKFSGPIDRVLAFESRLKLPRFKSNPLNGASAPSTGEHSHIDADTSSKRDVFIIVLVLMRFRYRLFGPALT